MQPFKEKKSGVQVLPEREELKLKPLQRVGLMGGTFNPIHNGHLSIAERALEQLQLDRVLFIPDYEPPHIDGKEKVEISAKDRFALLYYAIIDNPNFGIEPYELNKKGKSYTIDTVRYLKNKYPGVEFYFIIGGDMVEYLPKWKDIDDLVKLIHFVGASRPGYSLDSPYPILTIDSPNLEISSTKLRKMIQNGESTRYLIPDPVREYIERKGLYRYDHK